MTARNSGAAGTSGSGYTSGSSSARGAPAGTAGSSSTPKKATLEDVLAGSNFQVYQRGAVVAKQYLRTKSLPDFNPNILGAALAQSLAGMISEIPGKEEKLELGMLMDVLQRNLQNNTLTVEGFEAVLAQAKAFMAPYAQKVKGSLEDSHYRTMAMAALQNKDMFPEVYSSISAHPSAARASQLGTMLKEIEEQIKKNDMSGLSSYYDKLSAPSAVADLVATGKTKEQATQIMGAGRDAYQKLVGSMSENMKLEHQGYLHKLVSQGYYQAAQKIDLGHIKGVMNAADPADLLALIPQGRQGAGYQSE